MFKFSNTSHCILGNIKTRSLKWRNSRCGECLVNPSSWCLLIRFLLISRWGINYLSQFTVTNWRHQNLYFFYLVKDKSAASAGMVAAEASKGMGADEESFNVPVPVTQKVRDACVHKGIKMMQVWFNWQ